MTLPTLTIDDVAAKHAHHPVTVRLALSDLSLHGVQRVEGGRWLIDADCADAWAAGEKCEHYANIVALRRKSA